VGAAVLTIAFYGATFVVVGRYYATHLPHYDSIGSYTLMFEVMNTAQRDGVAAALALAMTSSISWLQPLYALLLAPFAAREPQILVSLNFLLLLVVQCTIVICIRDLGYGPLRQFACAMLPLLPGILYVWDGGLQDLRRDVQTNLLLTASLFLGLAYAVAPSRRRALALGIVLGLCQWSRDNALPLMLAVTAPAAVVAVRRSPAGRRLTSLFRLGWRPLLVLVVVAAPFYLATFEMTRFRYSHVVWGVGESRLESFLAWWSAPLDVFLAGRGVYNGSGRLGRTTAGIALAGVGVVAVLVAAGSLRLTIPGLLRGPGSLLTGTGAAVIITVLVYQTVILGYGPRWHGMPFAATVAGTVALLAGLSTALRQGNRARWHRRMLTAAVLAAAMTLVPLGVYRMHVARFPSIGATAVEATRDTAFALAQLVGRHPVAILSVYGFSRHHANYYLAQAGRPPLVDFTAVAAANGDHFDLEQPLRPGADPQALRASLDAAVRRYADFVVVTPDTRRYADPAQLLWPFTLGRPVVEAWLVDRALIPVARLHLPSVSLVVLKNRSRERVHGLHHAEGLAVGELGEDRQREHLVGARLGHRKVASLQPEIAIGLLEMNGNRVMDQRRHPEGGEMLLKRVATPAPDDVEVMVRRPIVDGRWCANQAAGDRAVVEPGDLSATRVPSVQMRQLDAQHGRLHLVEATVEPFQRMDVTALLPVVPEAPQPPGKGVVVGHDGARIPIGAQVLARVEAEAAGAAERAEVLCAVAGAVRLGSVLHDHHPM
jgi:hypothetical protein